MNVTELLQTAFAALLANKLRSVLTMLGILIGVAAIIAIVAVGTGGRSAIVNTIESTRLQNTIQILPKELVAPGLPQPGQVLGFDPSDFQLVQEFKGVSNVYGTLFGQASISANGKSVNISVEAGPSFLDDIGRFQVTSGRMFTSGDVAAHRPIALVSANLAQQLFGNRNPIGQTIQLGGTPLKIVGTTVSTEVNLLSGLFGNQYVYLPETTCQDIYPNWQVSEMDIEVQPGTSKDLLARRVVTALNIHAHNANAFEDSAGFLSGIEHTVGLVSTILTAVIGAIAGIALVVGGVGVMNIMLVSVTERTQEIGIRMSLGATRKVILAQFLIESVVITTLGGIAGILFGVLGVTLIRVITQFPVSVSWWVVVGSFIFSGMIGVLCGVYPANKAANLNPIDALRYE